jgi:hypothetical protein
VAATSEDNPSVAEVFRILVDEMRAGSTRPIAAGGLGVLEALYHAAFEQRLKMRGVWAREGENVRNAARQVGIIASAIASLENKAEITREMVRSAAAIAEEHCTIGYEEGRWCRSDVSSNVAP